MHRINGAPKEGERTIGQYRVEGYYNRLKVTCLAPGCDAWSYTDLADKRLNPRDTGSTLKLLFRCSACGHQVMRIEVARVGIDSWDDHATVF